ncbi:hypothetical protein GGQ92_000245 [Gracilibacillus halotolerans]|uniref:YlxR domain-containing protein n=1 Tax=Gracilibacillus halotolerans TaxID=74386 RepID=A0A841RL64_9BACI|nr:YlxR family protein [Gracilibacillus halotolerans]MBB6511478.1 hypothetical protein [Gracilibacillus halotolerans]
MPKQRKVPLRKCIVTEEMFPKKQLIRVVKTKEGEVFADPTGKKNGRGAYLSKDLEVINKAQQTNILERHLDIKIEDHVYDELRTLVGDQ